MSAPDLPADVQHLFTAIDHVGIAVPDLDEAMRSEEHTSELQSH